MKPSFDPGCQLVAAYFLRKQCKQLSGQLDGIREGSDVESVHRARVASRRLRAALGIFNDCFPNADIARWSKRIRKITQGLGAARDLDVQRQYLAGVLAETQELSHQPGIARLLVRIELDRDKLQSKVRKAVDRLEESGVVAEMLSAAKAVLKDQDDGEVSVGSPSVLAMAREHISGRLAEMLSYEASLEDPQDLKRHHAMRIAAKRLRYTMEAYRPAFPERSNESLGAVKQIQTLLGDLHDCDVWIDQLPVMLDKERQRVVRRYGHAGPLARLEPGIQFLLEQRQRRRQELFRQLQDFWRQQVQEGTWERIDRITQDGPDASPPKPDSAPQEKAGTDSQAGEPAVDRGGDARPRPRPQDAFDQDQPTVAPLSADT